MPGFFQPHLFGFNLRTAYIYLAGALVIYICIRQKLQLVATTQCVSGASLFPAWGLSRLVTSTYATEKGLEPHHALVQRGMEKVKLIEYYLT